MTTSPVPAAAARRAGVHYAFVIALLSGLAMFASFGLGRFAYGLLLPSMKSALALTYTESSLLAFASLSVYTVAAPLAGVLTARFGPRRIITLALAILSLALWGVSWAPSFWAAFVFFAVAGITSGLTAVPALGILSAWFAPHRRGP